MTESLFAPLTCILEAVHEKVSASQNSNFEMNILFSDFIYTTQEQSCTAEMEFFSCCSNYRQHLALFPFDTNASGEACSELTNCFLAKHRAAASSSLAPASFLISEGPHPLNSCANDAQVHKRWQCWSRAVRSAKLRLRLRTLKSAEGEFMMKYFVVVAVNEHAHLPASELTLRKGGSHARLRSPRAECTHLSRVSVRPLKGPVCKMFAPYQQQDGHY